jgi:hypothetical protein
MKTAQVFGIAPEVREYSYIDRGQLDATLDSLLERSTHVAIKGPSKCGKSWLRQKALNNAVTIQCRHKRPFTDIYVDALSQLGIQMELKSVSKGILKGSVKATGEGGLALLTKVSLEGGAGYDRENAVELQKVGRDVNDLRYVAQLIVKSGRRLVIEDFHYLSVEDRRAFAFDLKALWDYGLFVVIVGVWSETNLLLYLNTDLTGRVHEVSIDWNNDDLKAILEKGGNELNIKFSEPAKAQLAKLAYFNAGILQQLALFTLDEAKITEKRWFTQNVDDLSHIESASMLYADQLNPVYQQFAKNVSSGIKGRRNSTGIYAHALAVILSAPDEELMKGVHARKIFERASKRQSRIQFGNLKTILKNIESLQIDEDGRGLLIAYNDATEEVTVIDRQLLLYRRFATVKWPWEEIINEADQNGGQVEADANGQ